MDLRRLLGPTVPTTSPSPPTKQISDDNTFNVLHLNANGIRNKLTELGVVLEGNKVKVAVIQESKLSPKSKNPCIQNYTTVRKDRSHGQGRGLLIYIHRSITFSKQPSSLEALSDPHLEDLSIEDELGNTKLIISNVYIPPASYCSNGYHSSIEHLLTTPDTLILGDFNAHHPSWYSRSTDTRGRKKMADSINGSDYGILNWISPTSMLCKGCDGCMGSISGSSCKCCMFVSCVHLVAVLTHPVSVSTCIICSGYVLLLRCCECVCCM